MSYLDTCVLHNPAHKCCVLPAASGQTHPRKLIKCPVQVVSAMKIIKNLATLMCLFYVSLPVGVSQNCPPAVTTLGMLWHTKILGEENCTQGRKWPHFSLNTVMPYLWSDSGGSKTVLSWIALSSRWYNHNVKKAGSTSTSVSPHQWDQSLPV